MTEASNSGVTFGKSAAGGGGPMAKPVTFLCQND